MSANTAEQLRPIVSKAFEAGREAERQSSLRPIVSKAFEAGREAERQSSVMYESEKSKFCSTQINLTGFPAIHVLGLGYEIPDEDLAKDGREAVAHVTVRYGLHDDNPVKAMKIISEFGPVKLTLGKVGFFPAGKDKDYDVIKIDVKSPDLIRLNRALGKLENTQTFTYHPHATIAYVKKGLGKKYADKFKTADLEITADTVFFSDKERNQTTISLYSPIQYRRNLYADMGEPQQKTAVINVPSEEPRHTESVPMTPTGPPRPAPVPMTPVAVPEEMVKPVSMTPRKSRADILRDEAKLVKFDPHHIMGNEIGNRDYDAIEGLLSDEEREEFEESMMHVRDEAVDEYLNSYEPKIDRHAIARAHDYHVNEMNGVVHDLIDNHEGTESELHRILEEWIPLNRSQMHAKDALQAIHRHMERSGMLTEPMKMALDQYEQEVAQHMEELVDQEGESQRDQERESISGDYVDRDDRRQYLSDFHYNNKDRYMPKMPEKTWVKDGDGDDVYQFRTSTGRPFTVMAVKPKYDKPDFNGKPVVDLQFHDDKENYGVSGKGEAFQIFSNVVPPLLSYLQTVDPGYATFSAQGESRQGLYDKLVKTLATTMPNYFATAITIGDQRFYLMGDRSRKDEITQEVTNRIRSQSAQELFQNAQPEMLVNSRYSRGTPTSYAFQVDEIQPELNEEWFTPRGWGVEDAQPAIVAPEKRNRHWGIGHNFREQDVSRFRGRFSPKNDAKSKPPTNYESTHAPKGGVSIGGKQYVGGQFIPGEVLAGATAEEKKAVESGESRSKPLAPSAKGKEEGPKKAPGSPQNDKGEAIGGQKPPIAEEPTTPPPPGKDFLPDVDKIDGKTGVTESARVGVPGMSVPPPPDIGRMPNLTENEREVESSFIEAFQADPNGMANKYLGLIQRTTNPGDPLTFETDGAKCLHIAWDDPEIDLEQRSVNRATLNVPLHQTANAIAKKAFVNYLGSLKKGDEILVTVGGCGAGKGHALKMIPETVALKKRCKAVWDSAGDQNATENPWIQQEAEKRGLKVSYLYVQADPMVSWADPGRGVIKRAGDPKDGRMVDALVFADSYAIGARNHQAFFESNKKNPNASFVFLENAPQGIRMIPEIPPDALRMSRRRLTAFALAAVEESTAPAHVKRGATVGLRIWGSENEPSVRGGVPQQYSEEPPADLPTRRREDMGLPKARKRKNIDPVGDSEDQAFPTHEHVPQLADPHRAFMASSPFTKGGQIGDIDLSSPNPPARGISESHRLDFPHGVGRAIWKPAGGESFARSTVTPGTSHRREVAASLLSEMIGMGDMVPKTGFRTEAGRHGSIQHWVEGATVPGDVHPDKKYGTPEEFQKAAIFDYLTGNADRHEGNWLFSPEGKMHLIDHGLTFPHKHDQHSFVHRDIQDRAAFSDIDIPVELKRTLTEKGHEIEQMLLNLGIEPSAVALTRKRMGHLADPRHSKYNTLPQPWHNHFETT